MDIAALERMIEQGRDSYEARLAVGQAHLKLGQFDQAIVHLQVATQTQPDKTVGWQLLGQAQRDHGDGAAARGTWERGIEVAATNGDEQAKKVMQVWLKRLG